MLNIAIILMSENIGIGLFHSEKRELLLPCHTPSNPWAVIYRKPSIFRLNQPQEFTNIWWVLERIMTENRVSKTLKESRDIHVIRFSFQEKHEIKDMLYIGGIQLL